MRRLKGEFDLVREGLMTFATLASMPIWDRLSALVCRSWRLPPWVSQDDVRQDLLLRAHRAIADYDPARGVVLKKYVVWNAINYAKKRAHKARGSYRHRGADSAPSRHELAISGFARPGDEEGGADMFLDSIAIPARQDLVVEVRELLDALARACRTESEHMTVRALVDADGSIEEAAASLYEDDNSRYACRLSSEYRSERFVRRTLDEVATRVSAA